MLVIHGPWRSSTDSNGHPRSVLVIHVPHWLFTTRTGHQRPALSISGPRDGHPRPVLVIYGLCWSRTARAGYPRPPLVTYDPYWSSTARTNYPRPVVTIHGPYWLSTALLVIHGPCRSFTARAVHTRPACWSHTAAVELTSRIVTKRPSTDARPTASVSSSSDIARPSTETCSSARPRRFSVGVTRWFTGRVSAYRRDRPPNDSDVIRVLKISVTCYRRCWPSQSD